MEGAGEASDRATCRFRFPLAVALTAIHEHIATTRPTGQGVLGFLLGDLCECPDTNVSYW